MSIDVRASRFESLMVGFGTDRGGDGRDGGCQLLVLALLLAMRVCRERWRASRSCAALLWVGARVGSGGNSSWVRFVLLRLTDDLALLGEEFGRIAKCLIGDPSNLGDGGDDPTDELSVIEAPLDRDGIDDKSESLSEFREEFDEIEDTFLNFWAVATSSALNVCTFVVERRTGAEIWILSVCLIEFDFVSLFWVGFSWVVDD